MATAAIPVLAVLAIPPASAEPLPEHYCSFELSPAAPAVLTGGVTAIVASVTPKACNGKAAPMSTVVCISGRDHPGVCAQGLTWGSAKAVLPGSNPHGTFTTSGRGCWDDPMTMVNPCTELGPVTVTI